MSSCIQLSLQWGSGLSFILAHFMDAKRVAYFSVCSDIYLSDQSSDFWALYMQNWEPDRPKASYLLFTKLIMRIIIFFTYNNPLSLDFHLLIITILIIYIFSLSPNSGSLTILQLQKSQRITHLYEFWSFRGHSLISVMLICYLPKQAFFIHTEHMISNYCLQSKCAWEKICHRVNLWSLWDKYWKINLSPFILKQIVLICNCSNFT